MTHSELLDQCSHRGVPAEPCEGELSLVETFKDQAWCLVDHAHRERLVTLYRCAECGNAMSVDLDAGRLLNQYPADPASMFRQLADAFTPPGGVADGANRPIARTK